jgi:hypothetical protein
MSWQWRRFSREIRAGRGECLRFCSSTGTISRSRRVTIVAPQQTAELLTTLDLTVQHPRRIGPSQPAEIGVFGLSEDHEL